MSYNISSRRLPHPLLTGVLEYFSGIFRKTDTSFYVIGAMARDIMMIVHNETGGRATLDLDIAIAISNWNEYALIEERILKNPDYRKDSTQKQRLIFSQAFRIDIIPFGSIMKEDYRIFWPPDESMAMSVLGFSDVQNATRKVLIDEKLEIDVASLEGVFLLKIVSWQDRNISHNRDADDMAFIMEHYLFINEDRAINEYYDLLYAVEDFNFRTSGAMLLGFDVSLILKENRKAKEKISAIIHDQLELEDESRLLNQMIETHRSLGYQDAYRSMEYFLAGLNRDQSVVFS